MDRMVKRLGKTVKSSLQNKPDGLNAAWVILTRYESANTFHGFSPRGSIMAKLFKKSMKRGNIPCLEGNFPFHGEKTADIVENETRGSWYGLDTFGGFYEEENH